jgi:hypothetical protein
MTGTRLHIYVHAIQSLDHFLVPAAVFLALPQHRDTWRRSRILVLFVTEHPLSYSDFALLDWELLFYWSPGRKTVDHHPQGARLCLSRIFPSAARQDRSPSGFSFWSQEEFLTTLSVSTGASPCGSVCYTAHFPCLCGLIIGKRSSFDCKLVFRITPNSKEESHSHNVIRLISPKV